VALGHDAGSAVQALVVVEAGDRDIVDGTVGRQHAVSLLVAAGRARTVLVVATEIPGAALRAAGIERTTADVDSNLGAVLLPILARRIANLVGAHAGQAV
jgi:hypothetical protein